MKKNAEQNLRSFLVHQEATETASASALTELAAALDLPEPPHRIECYDISNIQGTNSVASMVVFVEGRPKKSDYRHFNIQAVQGPDDFASMQETLRRRLRYLRQDADRPPVAESDVATAAIETQARKRERFHEKPDLLLIDGGKGQLNAVVEVMREMDMWGIPVAGLAKEHEWLFVPGNGEPIVMAPNSPGLHLVMRIRDEAHRFAIAHHRNKRGKAMTQLGARHAGRRRARAQEALDDGVRLGRRDQARVGRRDRRGQGDDAGAGVAGEGGAGRVGVRMGFLIRLVINAIALFAIAYFHIVHGIEVSGPGGALIAALILGVVNAILRPILVLLSLPLELVTLGLFTLVINALLFWLVGALHVGLTVDGFWPAFWGAIVMSIISWILSFLTRGVEQPRR